MCTYSCCGLCFGSVTTKFSIFTSSPYIEQHFANTLALTVSFLADRALSMVWAYFGAKKIDILFGRTNYSPLHLCTFTEPIDVVVHIYFTVYKASQLLLSYISSLIAGGPVYHNGFQIIGAWRFWLIGGSWMISQCGVPHLAPIITREPLYFGSKSFIRTAIDSMGRARLLGSSSSKRALPIYWTAHRVSMTGSFNYVTLKERGRLPTIY